MACGSQRPSSVSRDLERGDQDAGASAAAGPSATPRARQRGARAPARSAAHARARELPGRHFQGRPARRGAQSPCEAVRGVRRIGAASRCQPSRRRVGRVATQMGAARRVLGLHLLRARAHGARVRGARISFAAAGLACRDPGADHRRRACRYRQMGRRSHLRGGDPPLFSRRRGGRRGNRGGRRLRVCRFPDPRRRVRALPRARSRAHAASGGPHDAAAFRDRGVSRDGALCAALRPRACATDGGDRAGAHLADLPDLAQPRRGRGAPGKPHQPRCARRECDRREPVPLQRRSRVLRPRAFTHRRAAGGNGRCPASRRSTNS